MPVGSSFPKIWKSPIKIKFGKPLKIDKNKEYMEIAEYIMEEIKKL
ncbi:hypothetical protein [Persephonella sp. KM09-Lau-8]|nr:hypothetical protein [Persephonella sp. KM09-Lau-8]